MKGKGQGRDRPRDTRRQLEQQCREPSLRQSQQQLAIESQQQHWLPPLPAQFFNYFAGCKTVTAFLPVHKIVQCPFPASARSKRRTKKTWESGGLIQGPLSSNSRRMAIVARRFACAWKLRNKQLILTFVY
jgi:hypothetical protein